MSTTQKLRILTPQTTDGKNLAYDADKKPIYTESIAEVTAKKDFESLNTKLPEHLRHKLEIINEEVPVKVPVVEKTLLDDAQKAIEEKSVRLEESEKAVISKDEEIEELKKKLAEAAKPAEGKVVEAAKGAGAAADKKVI